MKKYHVNVNGNDYEVAIELISESEAKATTSQKAIESLPTTSSLGGEKITSPMPGNILNVNVKVGDAVKKGQVLLILEAMKMENEIMAPKDGTVTSVNVQKGSTVESGALLVTLG